MDEGLLNDLLECSVCLERLDTSSRVLPCQHTFCLKCLKVIVESHKELRCPECRVLVDTKVEELPPNVLLMRILEGMKNSAPRKLTQRVRTHSQAQVQTQPSSRSDKQVPPHGRAMYDYISKEPGDLSFKKGETILLLKKLDPFWYHGECSGRSGMFPITYVQVIVPLATSPALCKALYDFRMSAPDEEGCLAFDKGAIITVHRRVDENWAEGRLEQRVGIFPIAFVELNQAASQLMNSSAVSRPVPEPPRAGHSHRYQPAAAQANYHAAQNVSPQPNAPPGPAKEPTQTKYLLDIIHFTNASKAPGAQSASRINDGSDRFRTKFDNYSSKADATYQNVRSDHLPATGFHSALSSESSSSMNTPCSTTTPNTSSDTSTCDSAEPSLPSSPDDADRPAPNTSLNVSLPTEGPAPLEPRDAEPTSLPCSSRSGRLEPGGPDSLLDFGLGLQAALSPSHGKDGNHMVPKYLREHHHREKRHSLTPASHLKGSHNQNRHSAEILATSLLDHAPERERGNERDRERRRRRSRSNERPLPAAYVALYPYKPQKPDEIELKKGGVYTVRERCRDGWYKGWCERLQRAGVFPGNYVAPLTPVPKHDKATPSSAKPAAPAGKSASSSSAPAPPDAPPRAPSPQPPPQATAFPWNGPANSQQSKPKDKPKPEKSSVSSGVSLMKRLAAMKKCKSPPPVGYSMDNPVFDDSPNTSLVYTAQHPVHVRSGSCPSQLLRTLPPGPTGQISGQLGAPARHKERAPDHRMHSRGGNEGPWQSQHRKSQSLDVTAARRDRHPSQPAKERFRCVVPYPPNSEYELELKLDDIVVVSKKRGDGWYKGTLQRTGRSGLFPASFVQSCPPE